MLHSCTAYTDQQQYHAAYTVNEEHDCPFTPPIYLLSLGRHPQPAVWHLVPQAQKHGTHQRGCPLTMHSPSMLGSLARAR